jgi:hypothetical protein
MIVFIHELGIFGTIDKLGAFASLVKYTEDEIDHEEVMDNEDFSIMDEIVFEHIEEEN